MATTVAASVLVMAAAKSASPALSMVNGRRTSKQAVKPTITVSFSMRRGRDASSLSRSMFDTAPLWVNMQRQRSTTVAMATKWLLFPTGDGDSEHLAEEVPLPPAIELNEDVVVIGRDSERADVVVPVATVSGRHARIERTGEKFFVTDLGSTNGTFLANRLLKPNSPEEIKSGQEIIFGDEHLAKFRLGSLEVKEGEAKTPTGAGVEE